MKILIGSILLISVLFANEKANENDPLIDMLIIAKTTGMCGTIKQLSAFQESTKMPGGDKFIMRFINTEVARLGKTLPQFLNECKSSVAMYTDTMKVLGFEP